MLGGVADRYAGRPLQQGRARAGANAPQSGARQLRNRSSTGAAPARARNVVNSHYRCYRTAIPFNGAAPRRRRGGHQRLALGRAVVSSTGPRPRAVFEYAELQTLHTCFFNGARARAGGSRPPATPYPLQHTSAGPRPRGANGMVGIDVDPVITWTSTGPRPRGRGMNESVEQGAGTAADSSTGPRPRGRAEC